MATSGVPSSADKGPKLPQVCGNDLHAFNSGYINPPVKSIFKEKKQKDERPPLLHKNKLG